MRGAILTLTSAPPIPQIPMYHFSATRNHLHLPGKLLDTVFYLAEAMNTRSINEIDAISRGPPRWCSRPNG